MAQDIVPDTTQEDFLKAWFLREVLPLEPALTRYIRRNLKVQADVGDLRQEIYVRVFEAAAPAPPNNTKPFVFATARNCLIDRSRRARIISFDLMADPEETAPLAEAMTPERTASGREQLRRVQTALDNLPPRCRQVILLRRLEGLSQKQTAERLGISLKSVEAQTTKGMRVLAACLLDDEPKPDA